MCGTLWRDLDAPNRSLNRPPRTCRDGDRSLAVISTEKEKKLLAGRVRFAYNPAHNAGPGGNLDAQCPGADGMLPRGAAQEFAK